MRVEVQLKAYADRVDERLDLLLPSVKDPPPALAQAMRYACLSPGKRLRPALCMAACEAVGGAAEMALNVACAIEMVHAFSLVHDDLPALDNDDMRRGRPTCHVKFGEAVAILAGDGLFALAFQTLAAPSVGMAPAPRRRLACLRILAQAAGMDGLVAGEAADILAEGSSPDLSALHFIHTRKTGALISASCEMGATVATSDRSLIRALEQYGSAVGLAFQIADDVLNETSTAEELGKSAGSDRARQKATYPSLVGLQESKDRARTLAEQAVEHLSALPGDTGFLRVLASYAVERTR